MALARHAAVLVALVLAGAWTSFVDLVEARPASSGASTSSSSSSTVRLCGPRLVDLVWMLCMDRGGVHSHMDRRALGAPRSRPQQPFVIYRPSLPRPDGQEDEDSGSSERGTTATSIAANTYHHSSGHSNGGGIVDECCRKACSFATLASYCARPSAGSSLDAFNMLLASPADEARSSESAMQGDQAVEPTTEAPSPVESHVQHAQEVNREHNEVERTGPAAERSRGDGVSTGRVLIPGANFLRSPEEDTAFGPRVRIGTFSRHRPFFYVVQAAFNGDTEEALDA
ncbi:uncharacterized protein LOC8030654 [Ixodes scapularis]|uniref:uncharacterized protein LOC8030654 n=1 Tax=Ixodes scapularis TaxID=6945 RepID=UPI001C394965|nr:uncharacterized protein LOC8030654 [Ixodes scapularis]